MSRPTRKWSGELGGYTYDSIHLTMCQCNLSGGTCKCGHFEHDRRRERERLAALEKDNDPARGTS